MQEKTQNHHIVLVGGGHAHAVLLRLWAKHPLPGVRLTLVSPETHGLYTGMLPGLVAGHYTANDAYIDLSRLCRAAGAHFIRARACGIDATGRRLDLDNQAALHYDLLSLDIGAAAPRDLPGAALANPVKPVGQFYQHWQQLQQEIQHSSTPLRLGVIGGGAGGCELAMAMAEGLRAHCRSDRVQIHLVHSGQQLPAGYPPLARALVARELRRLPVSVHRNWPVAAIERGAVISTDGRRLPLQRLLLAAGASAPAWLSNTGLALDEQGFILVDDTLRAQGCDTIFAAGDAASFARRPLPKAGVYAVRQGPVLFHNLRAALTQTPLRRFRAQRHFLSLLSCGGRRAVATRNGLALCGAAMWYWKDHIDRAFVRGFRELSLRDRR
ncbi:FAD-dependent oxidoreductase [Microbulbifer sp. SAOS-129_SWC]|uniref:FAD-dependent oxidoreductase n=1 Tax=Microbulbifer sp. SAOS-129_SWC TaxID=3145235 RepID=UPI0032179B04